jgi:hypothetical protein
MRSLVEESPVEQDDGLMYYLEATILGLFAFSLLLPWFPSRRALMALTAMWVVGVSSIHWRYGALDQLTFYSNDQQLHDFLLGKLEWGGRPGGVQDLIDRRYLYTGPAFLLTLLGFSSVLALKFVSLLCFLVNAVVVHRHLSKILNRVPRGYFWLATGPIAFFFSLLALRETMLLLALTYLLIGKNPSLRLLGLASIALLRPHMAIAVVLAVITVQLLRYLPLGLYYIRLALALTGPVVIGILLYSIGYSINNDEGLTLARSLIDKDKTFVVLSNLVGLQFLNADFVAIERSLTDLLLPRLLFPETVIVPLLFTISLFVPKSSCDRLKMLVITTFGFYIGIVAGSDFTSFRQNLPFISVMAIVIIQTFRREPALGSSEQRQLVT